MHIQQQQKEEKRENTTTKRLLPLRQNGDIQTSEVLALNPLLSVSQKRADVDVVVLFFLLFSRHPPFFEFAFLLVFCVLVSK